MVLGFDVRKHFRGQPPFAIEGTAGGKTQEKKRECRDDPEYDNPVEETF